MLFFEDLEPGRELVSGPYELTEAEVVAFAQKFDPRPFHIDAAAATASPFGGLIAASAHTFAIAQALAHKAEPLAVAAALGIDEMRLPTPARPGDALWFSSTVIETRSSKSRPEGIARFQTIVRNGAGQPVLEYKITVLMQRRQPAVQTPG